MDCPPILDGFEIVDRVGEHWNLRLAHGSPRCAGHFPQDPVLSAVGQIQLVDWLRRQAHPEAATWVALEDLRCRRVLRPGAEFGVHFAEHPAKRCTSFAIECAQGEVTRGRMRW